MKHAFAEEGPPQTHTIEAADQVAVLPHLDAVAMTHIVQAGVEITDALVDPCVVAARLRRGTAVDDRLEGGVDAHGEGVGAYRARQPGGDPKAIEWNDAALFRLDPKQRGVVNAFRHWKDAAGISAQQHFRRYFGGCGVAGGHAGLYHGTTSATASVAVA